MPSGLPGDDDFGFTADTDGLARAYESGWMACRSSPSTGARNGSAPSTRAVGAHGQRDGAVEDAMQRILGTTPAEFTMRWQGYLREQFG
ncbi:hypothetical protein SHIRM173S_04598 [Streptomyces hirsutus]